MHQYLTRKTFCFKKNGIKPDSNYPVKFSMWCKLFPLAPVYSWQAKKDIIYAWIVNRESLDRVSWTSPTPTAKAIKKKYCKSFLGNDIENMNVVFAFQKKKKKNWKWGNLSLKIGKQKLFCCGLLFSSLCWL